MKLTKSLIAAFTLAAAIPCGSPDACAQSDSKFYVSATGGISCALSFIKHYLKIFIFVFLLFLPLASCDGDNDIFNVFITNNSADNIRVYPTYSGRYWSLKDKLTGPEEPVWFNVKKGDTYRYDYYDDRESARNDTLQFVIISEETLKLFSIEEIAADSLVDTIINVAIADFKDDYFRINYEGGIQGK